VATSKWKNRSYLLSVLVMLLVGCGSASEPQSAGAVNNGPSAAIASNATQTAQVCQTEGPLKELREARMSSGGSYDYPLGAGDVVHLSAAELPELNNVTVRVDGHGEIDLPLIGDLAVAGMSEDEVRQLIDTNARKYQKEPRIHLFIQHFAGRNVSVMGMVAQPGSYALTSSNESLLSILGRAGGIKGVGSEDAADMLVLFPARSGKDSPSSGAPGDVDSTIPAQCVEANNAAAEGTPHGCTVAAMLNHTNGSGTSVRGPGASVEPIIFDLSKPTMANCLDTPARPGDVVVVPAAGQVGVYGWVAKPGSFNITPGMTVLGAITAAGGAMFSSKAEVKRTVNGSRVSIPIDLKKVESGDQQDVSILAGDVILVRSSATGAVPYAVYTLFTKFGTGLYMAPAAF
jgi:protein involved in polysaccharide export with SLBB domain